MKFKTQNAANTVITGLSFALIIIIILLSNKSGQIDIKSGDVSTLDVYAPRAIVDTISTQAARKAASDGVEDVYITNDSNRIAAIEKVTDFFSAATSLRQSDEESLSSKALKLKASSKAALSEQSCIAVISASDTEFSRMRTVTDIINEIMTEGVDDAAEAAVKYSEKINALKINDAGKQAMIELSEKVITTNLEFDEEETKRRKEAAEQSVPNIEYKKNQIILRKGEIVSDSQIAMLEELGMIKGSNPLSVSYTVGIMLLALICYIIILTYFSLNYKKNGNAAIVTAVMGVISVLISFYGSRYIPENFLPFLPVGIFVSVVTVFSVPQTAIIFNVLNSIFCGVACSGNWDYTVCLILSGSVSAFCFGKVKRRSHLIPATAVSAFGYGSAFCAMSLIQVSSIKTALTAFFSGMTGGLFAGILTIGTLPFLEWLFNATTPMKLTELANPENKLLKKLLIEAPGTYHHSLTVANIAEIAAREIGADSLLARVGAYYHDIGKLRHPLYFKENQYNENNHDKLSPEESAALIIKHVTDGAEIAAKNHLPKIIRDMILQHHGTTTTGYFLIRAREIDKNADAAVFTYPGPTPQTKEAAIIMLADACEAAVRSISEKSEEKIETLVRKLSIERVNSGQFNKCNLTFSELETIIRTITKTLGGYFHERVKYE